jgi:hypothetical protein
MLQELNGDRREQRGIREKERLGLEWPKIVGAIATVWKEPWEVISAQRGNGGEAQSESSHPMAQSLVQRLVQPVTSSARPAAFQSRLARPS